MQLSVEGRTQEALTSLLEVDQDISKTLDQIVEKHSGLMEIIQVSIEAVTSVLIQGYTEDESSNGNKTVLVVTE